MLAPGQADAAGTTLTVDNRAGAGCSDTAPASATRPFCSIKAAYAKARKGDTIVVRPGTYRERVDVATAGITLVAPKGATVDGGGASPQLYGFTITASNVTVDGFTFVNQRGASNKSPAGVFVNAGGTRSADNVVVRNVTVRGSGGNGIRITSGTNDTITHATVRGSAAQGILLQGCTGCTVSASTTSDNNREGVSIQGGSHDTVENVTSYANDSAGDRTATRLAPGINVTSWTTGPASSITVQRNVAYDNDDSGIQVYGGSRNVTVRRNLVYDNGDHGIDFSMASSGAVVGNTALHNFSAGINIESNKVGAGSRASVGDNIAMNNGNGDGSSTPLRTRGDIRVDAPSVAAGSRIDHDLVFDPAGRTVLTWGTRTYPSLNAFHAAVPGQEVHGLNADARLGANHAPGAGSPAIDAADAAMVGWTGTDLRGNAPVDDPGVKNTGAGTPSYADLGAVERTMPARAPTAKLRGGRGHRGHPIRIDASGSHGNGGATIRSYLFQCGHHWIGPKKRPRAACVFKTLGVHRVRVKVTDSHGLTDWAKARVRVTRG